MILLKQCKLVPATHTHTHTQKEVVFEVFTFNWNKKMANSLSFVLQYSSTVTKYFVPMNHTCTGRITTALMEVKLQQLPAQKRANYHVLASPTRTHAKFLLSSVSFVIHFALYFLLQLVSEYIKSIQSFSSID